MSIGILIQLYLALLVVITVHEIGHFPKKINFKLFPFPTAAAIQAKYRLGGLIANVILFSLVFIYRPENIFLQYVGLIAWIHFIIYCVLGSIIPEKKESAVNVKSYIFDDVPNEKAAYFISFSIVSFLVMKSYFLPILQELIR